MNWTEVLSDIYQTQLELNTVALTAEEIVIKAYKRKAIELPEMMPKRED